MKIKDQLKTCQRIYKAWLENEKRCEVYSAPHFANHQEMIADVYWNFVEQNNLPHIFLADQVDHLKMLIKHPVKYFVNKDGYYFNNAMGQEIDEGKLDQVLIFDDLEEMAQEVMAMWGLDRDEIGDPYCVHADHYYCERGIRCDFDNPDHSPEEFISTFVC